MPVDIPVASQIFRWPYSQQRQNKKALQNDCQE